MRILFASSEVVPFSKTGGLADVAGALPEALARRGHRVTVVTPRYGSVNPSAFGLQRGPQLTVPVGGKPVKVGLLRGATPAGVPVLFVDHPGCFGRKNLYGHRGKDFDDNHQRFALFCRAALEACGAVGLDPDVIHCNDWQTGPIAALLKSQYRDRPELSAAGMVFTVHNLGYPGLFAPEAMQALGLGWELFTPDTLEFYGRVSYLKAGLVFADRLTTVSRRYAEEIKTPKFGQGLEGVINRRAQDLTGILNGADYSTWDPRADRLIARSFSPADPSGKSDCKSDLQRRMRLPLEPATPLIANISRLTSQKGIDLFVEAAGELLRRECQWVFLGEGDRQLEDAVRRLAKQHPEKLAVRIGFDQKLAHRILAGADIFLMPSRYEPCGLNQIYSLRYGTIPLVHAVGGLDDTVQEAADDSGNGFKFDQPTPAALYQAIERALKLFTDRPAWARLMARAMSQDFSWDAPARQYESVYQAAVSRTGQ